MAEFKDFLTFFLLTTILTLQNSSVFAIKARIVGGTPSTINITPHLIQLLDDGRIFCGGSLVAPRYVVSAAHCFRGIKRGRVTVKGGATRLSDTGVTRNVNRVLTPTAFNRTYMDLDVAVLELAAPMAGPNIRQIPLSTTSWPAGATVTVSGWGKTSEDSKVPSNQVRTVEVIATDKQTCSFRYRRHAKITDSMLCASVPGLKDSCAGDSGGPAVYKGELTGIVSWGVGCGRYNFPGIYTDVSAIRPFVLGVIKRANL